ncbi:MAG: phosphoribosylaminoimidazolesuccinocarboxamide synthase, partial [Acidobacteria bacterium]|nr:phosphoribosylaminoimidazolesuccinocarboxamide synthase [Acidobacteriota bacterium]
MSIPGLRLFKKGKVREVYEVENNLLIVASDRVSAFDWVLPSLIPDKGKVLTQLSRFWFDHTALICPNHMITADPDDFPSGLSPHRELLDKRAMLVRKTDVFPVECVVRGYIAGSGWKDYQSTGRVCGIKLPEGLQNSDRLETPIFTPATKAEEGHDVN